MPDNETETAEVAIYVQEDHVNDVMLALRLSFEVQPFPYEDKPGGPKTSIMRYTGPWNYENDKTVRHLQRTQVIKRFSRDWGNKKRH